VLFQKRFFFVKGDIRSTQELDELFLRYKITAVIHCAALKSVPESVKNPVQYYENNTEGTRTLLAAMRKNDITILIFSSSAAVYGDRAGENSDEQTLLGSAASPYATTKQECEQLITSEFSEPGGGKAVIFRYFNPIGAHSRYGIGDENTAHEKNIFTAIADAVYSSKPLVIYGNDYSTRDGTCVRDYVHVADIARAHADALEYFPDFTDKVTIINLGRGEGVTVLELLHCFEKAVQGPIAYTFSHRREGDLPIAYANTSKAKQLMNWQTVYTLDEAVVSGWKWYRDNL
jgi:UDP-glucose 4-epimerase